MGKKKCFPDLPQSNLLYIIKDLIILEIFEISGYYDIAQEYRETIFQYTVYFSDNRHTSDVCIYSQGKESTNSQGYQFKPKENQSALS